MATRTTGRTEQTRAMPRMERTMIAGRIEYRNTTSREGWGAGPWDAEPDKVQWVDEATNLDCLAVRGPVGSWCGYVGVPEGHPAFGKEYDNVPADVHGGLTFADFCAESTPEAFERWQARMLKSKAEIERYPKGDAAAAWAEMGDVVDDYEGWRAKYEARNICHVPMPGRPAKVWWLGFDCAHWRDFSPGMMAMCSNEYRALKKGDVYRTLEFVRRECTDLAAQLAAMTSPTELTE